MAEEETKESLIRELRGYVEDALSDFFYYDRKGDEDLSVERMSAILTGGVVTKEDWIDLFKAELDKTLVKEGGVEA